ncbi:hypothetical protein EZV62_003774 [Acer yangbiense]|uniref:Uncharacterized protein n=1 Tax=Acer yangbiense TaxID=1000413 RepID=A0A5C7IID6_9ROSI|nr:hypothetical protein EZV62_003774 [Acer yangbiense]
MVMGTLDFTSIIWFHCSDKEWTGVAALLEFTVLFDVLLYQSKQNMSSTGEMEIMKVSCQSNAVGGTSNLLEDENAVKGNRYCEQTDIHSPQVLPKSVVGTSFSTHQIPLNNQVDDTVQVPRRNR